MEYGMLNQVVVFDIDGVLSNNNDRLHYIVNSDGSRRKDADWESFYQESTKDPPIFAGLMLLKAFLSDLGAEVVFLTGRTEKHRGITAEWLHNHTDIDTYGYNDLRDCSESLIMRPDGDFRPDYEYKVGVLRELREKADIVLVIDDSVALIDKMVENGFTCLHFRRPGEQHGWAVSRAHSEKLVKER